jgi:hypothetical protein
MMQLEVPKLKPKSPDVRVNLREEWLALIELAELDFNLEAHQFPLQKTSASFQDCELRALHVDLRDIDVREVAARGRVIDCRTPNVYRRYCLEALRVGKPRQKREICGINGRRPRRSGHIEL